LSSLLSLKANTLGAFGKGLVATSPSTCEVHNWVRPVIYQLRGRRKIEHNRFPERTTPKANKRSNFIEWNYRAELYAFGKRLGENFEESLLTRAFIDKSFIHEEKKRQEELDLILTLPLVLLLCQGWTIQSWPRRVRNCSTKS